MNEKRPLRFGNKPARTDRKPAHPDRPAVMEGLAARRAALKVIRQVTEDGAYASLALDAVLKNSGLNSADRRLVSRLVYDTLDRMIWLDYVLAQVMARPDTDIKLRNILRLGACQILLEDRIPESAATNLCVQLCAENGMPGLKGVCNGILRNLIRRKDELSSRIRKRNRRKRLPSGTAYPDGSGGGCGRTTATKRKRSWNTGTRMKAGCCGRT